MKALSIRQHAAYLAGVLKGDGCISAPGKYHARGYYSLKVADRDFAETVASSLSIIAGRTVLARKGGDGYWVSNTYNGYGKLDHLLAFLPADDCERAMWLRGLFDSEGNAQFRHKTGRPRGSFDRRISMYSTDESTIGRAGEYMTALGVEWAVRKVKATAGHLGTKPVYEIRVMRRPSFEGFTTIIGSSIARKREAMARMVESYQCPTEAARRAQVLGAESKRQKTVEVTIPRVVEAIRQRATVGLPVTTRSCSGIIRGYAAARQHLTHSQLVGMACQGATK